MIVEIVLGLLPQLAVIHNPQPKRQGKNELLIREMTATDIGKETGAIYYLL